MKGFLACILSLSLLSTIGIAQNIPNGDFEEWTIFNHYDLDHYLTPNYNVSRTTERIQGQYALKLENTVSEDGNTRRSGYAYNVISAINQTGFAFEGDMLSVVFFAKYDLAEGDSARVYVRFRENGATKGYINFYTSGSTNGDFARFSVPIFWYGTRTPDEVQIYLYANSGFGAGNTVAGNGYIILDDFHFENIGKRGDNITNYGFDEWTNNGIHHPVYWRSLDLLVLESYNYFLADEAVVRSQDAYQGNSALRVGNYQGTNPSYSYVYIGTENDDYYTPAFKIYNRYKYLQGYYKYYDGGNDSGRITFRTFRNGSQFSYSNKYFNDADEWTFFSMPINYYNDSMPDSACIIAYSNSGAPNSAESYFLLDNLDLVMSPTAGIEELSTSLKIFPNPTTDYIKLNIKHEAELKVIDPLGKVILQTYLHPGDHQVNLSEQHTGMYYLIFSNNDIQWKTKILKL